MVINPDVVVRSRGVMEKCSFCIQMTQKTILDAKLEGREINDGEWKTACSSACSTGAIVFGDVNDKNSEVSKMTKNDRMYRLLESVGTKPNVMYLLKIWIINNGLNRPIVIITKDKPKRVSIPSASLIILNQKVYLPL